MHIWNSIRRSDNIQINKFANSSQSSLEDNDENILNVPKLSLFKCASKNSTDYPNTFIKII